MIKLERNQMSLILGGSTATAECGGGISVSCSGTYACSATDGEGCSCDDGHDSKQCPIA